MTTSALYNSFLNENYPSCLGETEVSQSWGRQRPCIVFIFKMSIRQTRESDLVAIAKLEAIVEKENRASFETICLRYRTDPNYWFVDVRTSYPVGYIEAFRWNIDFFETFDQVKDFPSLIKPNANNMYVCMLGVHPDFRREKIATNLIKSVLESAKESGCKKVQLIAGSGAHLVPMYESHGFKVVKELPNFLPYSKGTFMVQEINQ